jgi:formylglycine-generating enzyme required for sulfatase activity
MHDVFLSYNSSDRPAARLVFDALKAQGFAVFVDERDLAAGQNFIPRLEAALLGCKSVAILMGPRGLGKWQQIEKDLALDRKAKEPELPVIPVLLPGDVDPPTGFLSLQTWIDFRQGVEDAHAIARLGAALRGLPPSGAQYNPRFDICPYRGLLPFREEDRAFYFGRETEVEALLQLVRKDQCKVVPVIGSSGSGKSSLVSAGLIPRLRDPANGRPWEILTLRPGDKPLENLVKILSPPPETLSPLQQGDSVTKDIDLLRTGRGRLSQTVDGVLQNSGGCERLLLYIDQWEEIYTLLPRDVTPEKRRAAEADRVLFIDSLLEATENSACTLVFTVRADYYEPLLAWDTRLKNGKLENHLNRARFSVGQMSRECLRAAIEQPALKAGFALQPGLVDTILNELGNEPGNLPLLEFLLAELWQYHSQKKQATFTLDGYDEVGRVSGAIAKRAETTLADLVETKGKDGKAAEDAARRVFVSLVSPQEDATRDTRAVIDLPTEGMEREVIERFSAARLLTAGRGTVELAHEALIREWNTLRTKWLQENRDFLRVRDRIRDARDLWDPPVGEKGDRESGRKEKRRSPERLIPSGLPLQEARNLLRNHGDVGIDDIREYIRLSLRRDFWKRFRSIAVVPAIMLVPVLGYIAHPQIADFFEAQIIPAQEAKLSARFDQPRPATPFPGDLGNQASRSFTNSIGMELLWCVPGTFRMGSPESEEARSEDETTHQVTLTQGFWMGRYEVTQGEWLALMPENPSSDPDNRHYPVTDVNYDEAKRFCEELTKREIEAGTLPSGWHYTLPTEAQWEYACRAGTTTPFNFRFGLGGMLNGYLANCDGSTPYGFPLRGPNLERTTVAGVYPANRWGFHDMHGNVYEWCLDGYDDYPTGDVVDPTGSEQASSRVYRGGGWDYDARSCRSADRYGNSPVLRDYDLGFRPVLTLASKKAEGDSP